MMATHKSPFSGTWYPDDNAALDSLLTERFAESERRTGAYLLNDGLGYVVPHAGPAYSGTVAAAVYRSLQQQRPERVVLLAFPHRGGLSGVAVPDVDRISTALGEVAVDRDLGGFPRVPEAHLCDHSFEIQLPFLQKSVPGARIAALYVGHMDAAARREAARKIAEAWQPGTVFLASSDFTHYGRSFGHLPFPTDNDVAARLRELDFACMEAAGSLDSAFFLEAIEARNANACGTGPIALLLDVLRARGAGDIYQSILDYQTSGEIVGDYHHSVSYAALGYFPALGVRCGGVRPRRASRRRRCHAPPFARNGRPSIPLVATGSPALSRPSRRFCDSTPR